MNNDSPLVSVVIPCFNQAQFLGEAIESALGQTHGNLEVIVVDDGSTDETSNVAHGYEAVRTLRQANRGLAGARNSGLSASSGSYVVFLDADDRLLPNAVQSGLAAFEKNPECGFVFGHFRRVNEDGSLIGVAEPRCDHENFYLGFLRTNVVVMHGTIMFRKDVLAQVGAYDESLRLCEDYDLYLRISRQFPVACHHEVVADYRRHPGISGDTAGMLRGMISVLRSHRPVRDVPTGAIDAYRDGMRHWQDYYGAQLVQKLKARLRRRDLSRSVGDTMTLLRYNRGGLYRSLQRRLSRQTPAPKVGRINFGDLRRVTPVSAWFGFDRGTPVDRYYIEQFLEANRLDVRGRVLEVGDASYTNRYGQERVTTSDVLHVAPGARGATIVADLANAPTIPTDTFDCVILTQTLQLIFDVGSAIDTIHRILKPGGVVLLTVPGITQTDAAEWRDSWYWSFTRLSAGRLFSERFGEGAVTATQHGNVLAATAFLQGIAAEELAATELDHRDGAYPLVITVRAVKAET